MQPMVGSGGTSVRSATVLRMSIWRGAGPAGKMGRIARRFPVTNPSQGSGKLRVDIGFASQRTGAGSHPLRPFRLHFALRLCALSCVLDEVASSAFCSMPIRSEMCCHLRGDIAKPCPVGKSGPERGRTLRCADGHHPFSGDRSCAGERPKCRRGRRRRESCGAGSLDRARGVAAERGVPQSISLYAGHWRQRNAIGRQYPDARADFHCEQCRA